ncbi:hypothetical protein [Alloactinosynnema sp. L-07]|nr:hypothetical protein [Alloactinosynnema sp. L-07]
MDTVVVDTAVEGGVGGEVVGLSDTSCRGAGGAQAATRPRVAAIRVRRRRSRLIVTTR